MAAAHGCSEVAPGSGKPAVTVLFLHPVWEWTCFSTKKVKQKVRMADQRIIVCCSIAPHNAEK
jgi:hypothetical protein